MIKNIKMLQEALQANNKDNLLYVVTANGERLRITSIETDAQYGATVLHTQPITKSITMDGPNL